MLGAGIPVLLGVVAALWRLRTSKTDTYTRLRATVALGLAELDRTAIEALVRIRSKLPVTGFDRSMGAEDHEDAVFEYTQALRSKRRLQRRFRRLLASSTFLIVGLSAILPSGVFLMLRGAGVEALPEAYILPAWIALLLGATSAIFGFGGILYYEAKIASSCLNNSEGPPTNIDDD